MSWLFFLKIGLPVAGVGSGIGAGAAFVKEKITNDTANHKTSQYDYEYINSVGAKCYGRVVDKMWNVKVDLCYGQKRKIVNS